MRELLPWGSQPCPHDADDMRRKHKTESEHAAYKARSEEALAALHQQLRQTMLDKVGGKRGTLFEAALLRGAWVL